MKCEGEVVVIEVRKKRGGGGTLYLFPLYCVHMDITVDRRWRIIYLSGIDVDHYTGRIESKYTKIDSSMIVITV